MKTTLIIVLLSVFSIEAAAQNLADILKRNDRAIGLDRRNDIDYLQTRGYFTMNNSKAKIPFKVLQSRPGKLRVESTVFGLKTIQTYNGKEAWMLNPTMGLEATATDAKDIAPVAIATSLDGPFRYQDREGFAARLSGRQEYNGRETFVVITSETDTSRMKYYIDSETYLVNVVRYEYSRNGGWYSMEYRITGYMDFMGALFPSAIDVRINGVDMTTVVVEQIRLESALKDDLFERPTF